MRASTELASPSQPAAPSPASRKAPTTSRQRPIPDSDSTSAPKRWKAKLALVAVLAVVVLGVSAYLVWLRPTPPHTDAAQPAALGGQPAQPALPGGQSLRSAPPGGQTVLPFTGLLGARGVAVDSAGNVYAAAQNGVFELAAGASAPVQLPFTGGQPVGVAVDSAGTVYVADSTRNAVWKLTAGSGTPAVVSFTGLKCGESEVSLSSPVGLAVDSGGTIYVADGGCQGRVVALAAGSNSATVLHFTGLSQIGGVAVDGTGNVYVTDGAYGANGRVLKLAAGSDRPTALPFTGLTMPQGVAVDSAGNVYVADDGKKAVLKLATGGTQTALPSFAPSNGPYGVAADRAGNVYVTDGQRVVKLPSA